MLGVRDICETSSEGVKKGEGRSTSGLTGARADLWARAVTTGVGVGAVVDIDVIAAAGKGKRVLTFMGGITWVKRFVSLSKGLDLKT